MVNLCIKLSFFLHSIADVKKETADKEFQVGMTVLEEMDESIFNKAPKSEPLDIKPKIEADFVVKSERIDEFIQGMEIIDSMNIPVKAEMPNENLEKYKCSICNTLQFIIHPLMY